MRLVSLKPARLKKNGSSRSPAKTRNLPSAVVMQVTLLASPVMYAAFPTQHCMICTVLKVQMMLTSGEGVAPKLALLVVWNTYWTLSENLDALVAFRTRSMTRNTVRASGDIHVNTSVMSADGSAEAAGPSAWSADRVGWDRNTTAPIATTTTATSQVFRICNASFLAQARS